MRKILVGLILLIASLGEVCAQAVVLPCVPSGNSCIPVSAANPLPTTGGGGGGGLTIGTTTITGGATTQVLFNLGGVVSSDSGFTYAGSSGAVAIGGTLAIGAGSAITSSGAGGALGTNAFTSTAYLPLTGGTLTGNLTITPSSANTEPLTINLGTMTANTKGVDITGTWNNAGITFDAPLFVNITNTASASGVLLADFQVGGVSQYAFGVAGPTLLMPFNGVVAFGGTVVTTQDYVGGVSHQIQITAGNALQVSIGANKIAALNTAAFCWGTGTPASACDTGLSRDAAGVVDVGTGAQGSTAGSMKMTGITVSGASSVVLFTGLTNAATTSAVCYNTGTGAISYDATIGTCTVSALWHKNLLGVLDRDDDPLAMLRPIVYTYRQNNDGIGDDRVHIGLAADDVALMDERCATYDAKGRLSNYEDRCVLAYLVGDRKQLRAELEALRRSIAR